MWLNNLAYLHQLKNSSTIWGGAPNSIQKLYIIPDTALLTAEILHQFKGR